MRTKQNKRAKEAEQVQTWPPLPAYFLVVRRAAETSRANGGYGGYDVHFLNNTDVPVQDLSVGCDTTLHMTESMMHGSGAWSSLGPVAARGNVRVLDDRMPLSDLQLDVRVRIDTGGQVHEARAKFFLESIEYKSTEPAPAELIGVPGWIVRF